MDYLQVVLIRNLMISQLWHMPTANVEGIVWWIWISLERLQIICLSVFSETAVVQLSGHVSTFTLNWSVHFCQFDSHKSYSLIVMTCETPSCSLQPLLPLHQTPHSANPQLSILTCSVHPSAVRVLSATLGFVS